MSEQEGGMGGEGNEGDFQKFKILSASMIYSANLHHRAKVSQAVPEIWPFINFQNGRGTPSSISNSSKFNCPYYSKGQYAAPFQIFCRLVKPVRKYGRFQFFKMAAVRYLDISS